VERLVPVWLVPTAVGPYIVTAGPTRNVTVFWGGALCDKCQQLETDIRRYRRHLEQSLVEQSLDPLTIETQRSRKLSALGLDPSTIERVEGVIQNWFRTSRYMH
jgi:hypothetical protein